MQKQLGKNILKTVLAISILLVPCGCTAVPTRTDSTSNSESSSDSSFGGFLLGTLVVVGSIFLSDDDKDDCECEDDDDGITISFK